MKKLLLALLLLPAASFAQSLTEANYKIYSISKAKEVTIKEVISDMANYDVLFFGEEHNDSVAHHLEQSILELMHLKFGSNLALSLEMFDRDVQPVMDEYLQGYIREKHFRKDARVWSNYTNYRPMVEYAKENKLDVICANAATRYTNLVGRKGQSALKDLPESSKEYFAPVPYDTATGKYYKKLMALQHSPSDTAATKHMMSSFNMIQAQSLWDATMAHSIARYIKKNKSKKIMQVNGRFHSDEGFAIPRQLTSYNSKLSSLIISCNSDSSFPNIQWEQHTKNGDYIIITDPKVPKTYSEQ